MNLKNTVGIVSCSCAALLLAACQNTDHPDGITGASSPPGAEVKTLYVGPAMADCVGVAPMFCLLVKDTPDGDYRIFYDSIRGFGYVPGYEYELQVEVTPREHVPADASPLVYSLVEVVGKKKAGLALEDGSWELAGRIPGTKVDIAFQDGKVSGHAGVNRYFGSCAVDGMSLAVSQVGSTRKWGPAAVMEQEQGFLENLAQAAKYRIVGDQLRLINRGGQVVLVFFPRKQVEGE